MKIGPDTTLEVEASSKELGDVAVTIGQGKGPLFVHVTFDVETAKAVRRELDLAIQQAEKDKEEPSRD
jgi:hypothetical protein